MEVKGTAVLSIPRFIEEKFGKEKLQDWVNQLSPEAKAVFSSNILPSQWFSLNTFLEEPTKLMCKMFYGGSAKGAWEGGRSSASYGLSGILKIFVKMGSPSFIISRATTILPTYYKPSEIKIAASASNSVTLQITQFPELSSIIEHRIGGWMERALEIQGCKDVNLKITRSVTKGDSFCEYDVTWK